ncbi:unnamed protein product [Boreogadus saida]
MEHNAFSSRNPNDRGQSRGQGPVQGSGAGPGDGGRSRSRGPVQGTGAGPLVGGRSRGRGPVQGTGAGPGPPSPTPASSASSRPDPCLFSLTPSRPLPLQPHPVPTPASSASPRPDPCLFSLTSSYPCLFSLTSSYPCLFSLIQSSPLPLQSHPVLSPFSLSGSHLLPAARGWFVKGISNNQQVPQTS